MLQKSMGLETDMGWMTILILGIASIILPISVSPVLGLAAATAGIIAAFIGSARGSQSRWIRDGRKVCIAGAVMCAVVIILHFISIR